MICVKKCEIVSLILPIKTPSTYYTKRRGVRKKQQALATFLDKLCMVANINTRKLIELKKEEIKIMEAKIQALSELIDSLEQKINNQARRLDALMLTKNYLH